jgi:hypothetical protein
MTDDQSKTGTRVLILGLAVLVVGIVIALIPVTQEQCVTFFIEVCENVTTFPFAPYGGILFIVGLVMIVIGAIMAGSGSGSGVPAQAAPQQAYYGQPAPTQYAQQPYAQQQPAQTWGCPTCGRPYYAGETVCQGCGYGLPATQ